MIHKVEHTRNDQALDIRRVFQVSYKVEAELLGASNFPPLSRPIDAFIGSANDFWGFYEEQTLVAVVEIKKEKESIHFQSLVVAPDYFRRGIASQLINHVLQDYQVKAFTVETGRDNTPARKLYEGLGFKLLKTYTADENIVKVRYQIKM